MVATALLTHIYALEDPRDGTVRYVGKADDPRRRLSHHLKPHLLSARSRKNSWIKTLLKLGLRPTLRVLEQVLRADWESKERYWIKHFREVGQPLTNGTEGGDGGAPLPEIRAIISAKLRGRKLPAEQRRKMSLARRGKRRSLETIRRFSMARMGHQVTAETRLKLAQANRGRKHTEEARRAISAAGRGRRQAAAKTQYLGVSYDNRRGCYSASLVVTKTKSVFLGSYAEEEAAARARDAAALAYFGAAAILNFPHVRLPAEGIVLPFSEVLKGIRHRARQAYASRRARLARSSRFRGVVWIATRRRWDATISFCRRNFRLGSYTSEAGAAVAYDLAAQLVHGDAAVLNYPTDAQAQRKSPIKSVSEIRQELLAIREGAKRQNQLFFRKRPSASSPFYGVFYANQRGHWQAFVKLSPKKRVYVGAFRSAEQAALAHDRVAREHLGAHANLNFPDMAAVQAESARSSSLPRTGLGEVGGKQPPGLVEAHDGEPGL